EMLSTEIALNIENDAPKTAYYYTNKTYVPKTYQADIKIKLRDVEPLASLLGVNFSLSPDVAIEGSFTSGRTAIFQAFTKFDSLQYENTLFLKSDLQLTASKISDSTSMLAMASFNSENQSIGKQLKTKNLLAEGIWNRSHIEFGLDADQVDQSNNVRMKGAVDFLSDSTRITLAPSALKLLEREWSFREGNFIKVKNSGWRFNQLELVHGHQSIAVNGTVSENPSHVVTLDVNALDLSLLNVLTNKKFIGTMDAELKMSNYYGDPSLENDISIKGLNINEFLIGDITGKNEWDTAQHKFDINLFIDRTQERILDIVGNYAPSRKESPLDITANLNNANLKIVEPFIDDILSQIEGTISGAFKISGPLDAPQINGEGQVAEAQIMINYLRTMYKFTGRVGLTPGSIYFKDIELTDAFRNKGKLNCTISHQNYRSMAIALDATFRNFQVLNTSIKDNSLFYGQAFATGDVNFSGPLSNLRITSNARTEKNTRVYIPIGGLSSVDRKDFITFVNFTDTTFIKKVEKSVDKKINLTGLTFDLNLNVTPDAYCEIIFDLKAGDIIRGRGNGDLKLQIDTKGEFNMFGPVEFTEGWYNFTLYDIINKEFEIQKGSRITWFGDPYQAVLEINASYNQLASFLPIVLNQDVQDNPPAGLRRKYPAMVLLKIDGPMLSPQINFDITARDLPQNILTETGTPINLNLEFTAFKNRLDEQELKRQVFSLIILRRFSSPESFNTSGSVVSSLSELLSNQLSYWMSQVDENLEIDVDVSSMDQESFNTFQLRFAYTFMNGRLRVSGDGTFNNTSQNPGNQPNPSTVAGDWTVEYKLTADGKLRVKMYSRTNVNPILSSVSNQTAITTGASILYTQSFNEIRDIFRSSRERKKNEAAEVDLNTEALKEEDGGE
ncbi:MAG TPA: translocation/assembly module TamB domain-containing protein, partial [Chryseolinea sp.]|nr:translocation/assembly module TamB domain-containing protein [Chryseolinea sp.]